MNNIPKKIYLQIGEENDIDDNFNHSDNFNKLEGITWSEDRINKTDIEYSLLTEQATGMKWKKAIEDLPIRNVRVTARWNKTDDGYEGGWHRASRDWLDATLKTHPDVEWLDESPMQSKEGDDDRNKTDFEIFQDMIDSGEDIRMSPHFISADLIKQGGKVCMGVESKEIHDLMTGEFTCALYIVNSKQFFDRKNKNHDKLH